MEYYIFKTKVEQLIEERKKLHSNDNLRTYKYWERLSDFMGSDEIKTIKFLNECDADTAGWISEIFDDLSKRFRSENIITALDNLDKKFPDLNLTSFVDDARSFL